MALLMILPRFKMQSPQGIDVVRLIVSRDLASLILSFEGRFLLPSRDLRSHSSDTNSGNEKANPQLLLQPLSISLLEPTRSRDL